MHPTFYFYAFVQSNCLFLQMTSLAANLLLGNMPVALIPSFKMCVILSFLFVQFCFSFMSSFLSQNILQGYDPTSAGWKRTLQGMAPPQFKDDWGMCTQFVKDSVARVRKRDTQRAQEKYGSRGLGRLGSCLR